MTKVSHRHDEIVDYSVCIGYDLENFKRLIGKKLRERRTELGFENQDDFAQKIDPGLNRETVSKWERGINLPQEHYQQRICEVLKTDLSFFDIEEETKSDIIVKLIILLPKLYKSELQSVAVHIYALLDRRNKRTPPGL